MAQVIDVSMFFNEFDILRVRLEELYPVVNRFIIIENDKTLRGEDKGYWLTERIGEFKKYQDKMQVVDLEDNNGNYGVDEHQEPWHREYWQRNSAMGYLEGCDPDDIIIFGDVDEIPRRSFVRSANPNDVLRPGLKDFSYGINMWTGGEITGKIVRYRAITTPQETRTFGGGEYVADSGWHFSSIGDARHISRKLRSFAHWELDTPYITDPENIQKRLDAHQDIIGWGHNYHPIEIDETFPEEIKNNREFWRQFTWAV